MRLLYVMRGKELDLGYGTCIMFHDELREQHTPALKGIDRVALVSNRVQEYKEAALWRWSLSIRRAQSGSGTCDSTARAPPPEKK